MEFQERIKQKKKILQKEDEEEDLEEDLEEGVLMISTEKDILEVVEEDDEEIQGEKPRKLRKQSQLLGR